MQDEVFSFKYESRSGMRQLMFELESVEKGSSSRSCGPNVSKLFDASSSQISGQGVTCIGARRATWGKRWRVDAVWCVWCVCVGATLGGENAARVTPLCGWDDTFTLRPLQRHAFYTIPTSRPTITIHKHLEQQTCQCRPACSDCSPYQKLADVSGPKLSFWAATCVRPATSATGTKS